MTDDAKIINATLARLRANRTEAKALRAELIRLMVECCNVPQEEALSMSADFLDGFLVGQGHWPAYRDAK